MVKKRNIVGVDRRGGRGYVQMDCSGGIAGNCQGAVFVPGDTEEGVCSACVIQLAGTRLSDGGKRIRKAPRAKGKGKRRGK